MGEEKLHSFQGTAVRRAMASTSSAGSAKRKRVTAEGVGADIIDFECPVCMELMTGTINQVRAYASTG